MEGRAQDRARNVQQGSLFPAQTEQSSAFFFFGLVLTIAQGHRVFPWFCVDS